MVDLHCLQCGGTVPTAGYRHGCSEECRDALDVKQALQRTLLEEADAVLDELVAKARQLPTIVRY